MTVTGHLVTALFQDTVEECRSLNCSDGLQRTLGTLEESPGPPAAAAAEDGRSPDRHGSLRRTASSGRIESHTHG